jgi:hypothetical protein
MAGKKGAKKTVGKARKGDTPKFVMRLHYVQKPNGALAPRYERVDIVPAAAAEAEPAAQ